jgi:hypothetical protein
LGLQTDLSPVLEQTFGLEIELEGTEADNGRTGGGAHKRRLPGEAHQNGWQRRGEGGLSLSLRPPGARLRPEAMLLKERGLFA